MLLASDFAETLDPALTLFESLTGSTELLLSESELLTGFFTIFADDLPICD